MCMLPELDAPLSGYIVLDTINTSSWALSTAPRKTPREVLGAVQCWTIPLRKEADPWI